MRKILKLAGLLFLLAVLTALGHNLREQVSSVRLEKGNGIVVIDAGHGGRDPGKVGVNDVLEKDINLSIARKTAEELEKHNIQVVMTRTDDKEVEEGEEGSRKVQDMKARVAMINEIGPELAVSIHQNSYSDSSASGLQIFYYTHSSEGDKMAQQMEQIFLSLKNTRVRASKANDTYYLLRRTEVPTLIIECGFLSNPEEAQMLAREDYQQELAEAIADGIAACVAN